MLHRITGSPVYGAHDLDGGALPYTLDLYKRRWKIFALAFIMFFGPLCILAVNLAPRYEAVARIRVNPEADMIGAILKPFRGQSLPDLYQIDSDEAGLLSREAARKIADELSLIHNNKFNSPVGFLKKFYKKNVSSPRRIEDELLNRVRISREPGTYLVDISFEHSDPVLAASIANSFASYYVDRKIFLRRNDASEQANFLRTRIAEQEKFLDRIDSRINRARAETGTMLGRYHSAYANNSTDELVAPLTSLLATADAAASAAQERLSQARAQIASGDVSSNTSVLGSQVIADLRAQQANLQVQQSDLVTSYGPNHPAAVANAERLRLIDQQLDEEGRRIVGALASEAAAASAQAMTLRNRLQNLRIEQAANTQVTVMANSLEKQAKTQRETYSSLTAQQQRLDQAADFRSDDVRVVEAAVRPAIPFGPNRTFILAMSFILAFAAGSGMIAAQDVLEVGLRTSADVENQLGLPLIASIPALRASNWIKRTLGMLEIPSDLSFDPAISPFSESFRLARIALLRHEANMQSIVISIMSTVFDEGKTISSLAMSRVFAASGERVLLIDCDLRRNGLSRLVGNDGRPGLIELLENRATLSEVIRSDRVNGLDIIPIVQSTFTARDQFGSGAMEEFLRMLRREGRYERIILDTPHLLGVADARTLASLSDAAILLIKWNSTSLTAIKRVLTWLRSDKAPLVGAIFTMVDEKSEVAGATYYSNRFNKYYSNLDR